MTNISYKYYVGIDVSKANLDIALSNAPSVLRVANNEAGLKELIKTLPGKKHTLIVMEATGGYEQYAAGSLRKKKYNVAVVNAKRVRDFAKASGALAKTDTIDAKIIMQFGKVFNPKAQPPLEKPEALRQDYLTRRSQLVKMIAMEKQHLEHASQALKPSIKKHISDLEKQLVMIEQTLEASIEQEAPMNEKMKQLKAIKGVGKVVAMNLLIQMPELGTLSCKQASALAGVAPFNQESGQSKGRRKIWGGRASLRAALYMAILSAIRCNAVIKKFYDRLVEKGKARKVAMVACMRKLIVIINAMLRDGSSWLAPLKKA